MKKPTEKHIEKYVRFREELSPGEITWIKQAVEVDHELRMLANWFAAFYEMADGYGNEVALLNSTKNKYYLVTHEDGELVASSNLHGARKGERGTFQKGLSPAMKAKVSRRSSKRSGYILAKSEKGNQSVEVVQGSGEVTVIVDNGNKEAEYGILLLESEGEPTLWKIRKGKVVIPGEVFRDKELSLIFYLIKRNQKAEPYSQKPENNEAISGGGE